MDDESNGRRIEDVIGIGCVGLQEMAVGLDLGQLEEKDVVRIALRRLKAGVPQHPDEEALALLLSDELYRVRPILARHAPTSTERPQSMRVWLYFAATQVRKHWSVLSDPEIEFEEVLNELDEQGLYNAVRLYTPPEGAVLTKDAHLKRIDEILEHERRSFADC